MSKRHLKKTLIRLLIALASVMAGILLWWGISEALLASGNRALPSPWEVFATFFASLFTAEGAATSYPAMGWTFLRFLVGFLSAFLVGGLLGTLSYINKGIRAAVKPWNSLAKVFPTAAVSLLLLVLFSRNAFLMNVIPAILAFFVAEPIVYEGFLNGLRNGNSKETKEALKLDTGRGHPRALFEVELPGAGGYVLTSLAQSMGLSMKVTVMSEVLANFSNVNRGVGSLIVSAQQMVDMDALIAYSLLAVLMMGTVDLGSWAVKRLAKRLEDGHPSEVKSEGSEKDTQLD